VLASAQSADKPFNNEQLDQCESATKSSVQQSPPVQET
jgi:hypothetical protein